MVIFISLFVDTGYGGRRCTANWPNG